MAHWIPLADAGRATGAGGRRQVSRAGALALAGTSSLLTVAGLALYIATREVPTPVGYAVRGFEAIVAVPLIVSGLVLTLRRPRNVVGWLHATAGLLIALNLAADGYSVAAVVDGWALPAGDQVAWLRNWLWVPFMGLLAVLGILLFPDGRLPSTRWRPALWFAIAAIAVGTFAAAFQEGPLENFTPVVNPFGIDGFTADQAEPLLSFLLFSLLLAVASMVVRFRRSTGETRQQLKVMVFAAVIFAVLLVVEFLAQGVVNEPLRGLPARATQVALSVGMVGIPVAQGIAILRHGLYEIDVVISKALLFTVLAAFITALYAAVVAGASAVAGTTDNPWLPLLAAAVVAIAFQPARERVRVLADRLVYGSRVNPYDVLSSFSAQIATTFETEKQLEQMARLLGEGTGAVRADVLLVVGGEERAGATWPPDAPAGLEPDLRVPVTHQGEQLGVLAVTKPRNDSLTPQDQKLTVDLAAQAGIALRNVGLTSELLSRVEELRASRQRLVSAQDEERRRIERDLHDGAQQQLVALKIKLGLARLQAEDEGATETAAQLEGLAREAGEALDTLRDLAHGIYPPLLAAEGLVAALESHGRKTSLPVDVVADDRARRYPPEIEVASYYCCLEALQNASKYADASTVVVSLHEEDGHLVFEVRDDGRGFDVAGAPKGAGLRNMTDRVDALSGTITVESSPGRGTCVRGRVPTGTAPSSEEGAPQGTHHAEADGSGQ